MLRIDTVLTGLTGSPYFNRLFFNGDSDLEAEAARDAVVNMWTSLVQGVSPIVGRVTPTVQGAIARVNVANGQILEMYNLGDTPVTQGSSTVAVVPNACQVLLRFKTNSYRAGRRIQGKMFIPCTQNSDVDTNGNPRATLLASIENAVSAQLATAGHVVWSRPSEKFALGTSTPVIDYDAWTEYAVLRSRRD